MKAKERVENEAVEIEIKDTYIGDGNEKVYTDEKIDYTELKKRKEDCNNCIALYSEKCTADKCEGKISTTRNLNHTSAEGARNLYKAAVECFEDYFSGKYEDDDKTE